MEEKLKGKQDVGPSLPSSTVSQSIQRVKIGRPGYEITKSRHHQTNQRCLSFQLHFPEIDSNAQPRHRFMSAFEQRVESPPDRRYQYLLVAAEPYETVAFKVPNEKIDRSEGMFVTNWDEDDRRFTLTLFFVDGDDGNNVDKWISRAKFRWTVLVKKSINQLLWDLLTLYLVRAWHIIICSNSKTPIFINKSDW